MTSTAGQGAGIELLIEDNSRYAQVTRQLSEMITSGSFSAGQPLPNERRLADLFGVSRATIREALRVLQLAGQVEKRIGAGTYVTGRALRLDLGMALSDQQLPQDLLEARALIEPTVAELAAVRRTDEALERLLGAFQTMHDEQDRHEEISFEADRAFHAGLAWAAQNGVLENVVGMLYEGSAQRIYRVLRARILAVPQAARQNLDEHLEVLQAVQRGDGEGARAAMRRHARWWRRMSEEIWSSSQ